MGPQRRLQPGGNRQVQLDAVGDIQPALLAVFLHPAHDLARQALGPQLGGDLGVHRHGSGLIRRHRQAFGRVGLHQDLLRLQVQRLPVDFEHHGQAGLHVGGHHGRVGCSQGGPQLGELSAEARPKQLVIRQHLVAHQLAGLLDELEAT